VLLSNIIAWPAAYFAMSRWLQNFAFRIDFSIFIFLVSGALSLLISLLTISSQTVKAAISNPVDSLRHE
jgi:putative ABC transport system permease protein